MHRNSFVSKYTSFFELCFVHTTLIPSLRYYDVVKCEQTSTEFISKHNIQIRAKWIQSPEN